MSDILINNLGLQNEVAKEPTGFPDRTLSTFSFVNGTRTFTLQPITTYYEYWIHGIKHHITTSKSIVIPNTSGKYFIRISADETLDYVTTFSQDLLNNRAFVAVVYWNATTGKAEFITDERHGLTMDWATHFHLHNSFGTRYYNGFAISYTLGDGSLDSHAQIALSGGTIADEDLATTIIDSATPTNFFEQKLSAIAQIPAVYKIGTDEWRKDTANNFPLKLSTTAQFNSSNSLTSATNGNYVAVWLFAIPSIIEPIIAVLGTRQDTTQQDAENNNVYSTINFGDLPSLEYKVIYRIILQTNSAYANAAKSRVISVQDLRGSIDSSLVGVPASTASIHANLIGLNADDHPQYHNDTRGDARYPLKSVYVSGDDNASLNFKKEPIYHVEDFCTTTNGTLIPMVASTGAGGAVASNLTVAVSPNWNSATNKLRVGLTDVSITAANASRASLSTNANYRLIGGTTSGLIFGAELTFNGGQVDFANDPVFRAVGLLTSFAGFPLAASGVYFRCPRVGETSFLKGVIMQAGVETIFDTTIAYDSTTDRFIKVFFEYKSTTGDLIFTATDGTTTSIVTVPTFLTTYASLATLTYSFGFLNVRNGAGLVPIARNMRVDKAFRVHYPIYTL